MGLGTIPARTNGQTIADTWFNVLRTALSSDFVPRDANGVVTDIGASLGSTAYAWLYAYLTQLKLRSNSNYVTFKAPNALAANYDLITPDTLPTSSRSMVELGSDGQLRHLHFAGIVVPFAGSSAPSGWLLCGGQNVSRTDYADLFNVIGTTYGSGDGSTTFGLPDLRGRAVAGKDDMASGTAGRITNAGSGITGTTLGAVGGTEGVALTSAQSGVPAHSHTASDSGHAHGLGVQTGADAGDGTTPVGTSEGANGSTSTNGASANITVNNNVAADAAQAHRNVQPTIVLNYIIKT